MGIEEAKDLLKNVDWKTLGKTVTNEASGPVFQKRLPKKLRQVPDYYFLPKRSIRSALALSTIVCAAGVGAGMLVEIWINKKIQDMTIHLPQSNSICMKGQSESNSKVIPL